MRYLIILVPAVISIILIAWKRAYRVHITAGFILLVVLLNMAYNFYAIDNIMPFIRPTNQLTYQKEFQERKEFPDALIPLIIKGKRVYVKDDYLYKIDDVEAAGFSWLYTYFHYNSTVNYVKCLGADVLTDERINNTVVQKEMLVDFVDFGYANDMYRNTNIYSGYNSTDLNYFGHYWYYNTKVAPMHIYINTDGILDSDELVWLWQPASVTHEPEEWEKELECYNETEYMFIMSKNYYDSHF